MGLLREEGEGFAEDKVKWGFGEAGHRLSGNQASLVPLLTE